MHNNYNSTYMEHALYNVANDACDRAFAIAGSMLRTLKGGRSAFYPKVDLESHRIGVGIVEQYHYLVYQDTGFASFVMRWALGRTIPIHLPNGKVIYRKCTSVGKFRTGYEGHPGRRNYWYRGADGKLVPKFQQRRSWTHPGLGPKNFIAQGVEGALEAGREELDRAIVYDSYEHLEEELDRRWHR